MIENITQTRPTRAVLVGLNTGISSSDFDRSMDELKELVKAIDIETALTVTQSLPSPDRSTYIGSGKVEEIAASLDMFDIDLVVVGGVLSPMQARNLEKALDTPAKLYYKRPQGSFMSDTIYVSLVVNNTPIIQKQLMEYQLMK